MVYSMTGYGREKQIVGTRDINVEVKSVNSRYFEYSSRMPRSLSFLDDGLKKALSAKISRGKVELYLGIQSLEDDETEISPNISAARGYLNALEEISEVLGIENNIKASSLARFNEVFTTRKSEIDEDGLKADVMAVAEAAFEKYNAMRALEGEKLLADISARLLTIENLLTQAEELSKGRVSRYTQKLNDRLTEILADKNIDEARILTEAAIFADKTAVDEETVRLRSHLKQFEEILAAGGAVGRKLDFLTQEINRETNTIGSKCQELDVTRLVVDMKAEIEKIREQIQNLE